MAEEVKLMKGNEAIAHAVWTVTSATRSLRSRRYSKP